MRLGGWSGAGPTTCLQVRTGVSEKGEQCTSTGTPNRISTIVERESENGPREMAPKCPTRQKCVNESVDVEGSGMKSDEEPDSGCQRGRGVGALRHGGRRAGTCVERLRS